MAEQNATSKRQPFEYRHHYWGELISGTTDELQALGLGVGLPYPGEPGGPKRAMTVRDPRGLSARIERAIWDELGNFTASIEFPGRSYPDLALEPHAPGVTRSLNWYSDEFVGSADALVAAGIVSPGCFPGQPGMRKVCVTIHADGTIAGGVPTVYDDKAREPGAKRIRRKSKSEFEVAVYVSGVEAERRRRAGQADKAEWERKMFRLPRPAPLQPLAHTEQEQTAAPSLSCRGNGRKDDAPSHARTNQCPREVLAARADAAFQGMLSRLLDQRSGWAT